MPRRVTILAVALLVVLAAGAFASTLRGEGDYPSAARTPGQTDSVPTVSVTSPNGGEHWPAGTVHDVNSISTSSTTGTAVPTLLPDSIHDIALVGILAPDYDVDSGVALSPQVRLANVGTSPEGGIPVHVTIDSSGNQVYNQTFTVSFLASGDSYTATFPNWTPGPGGSIYQVTAWHSYSPDTNRLNDTLHRAVTVAAPPTVTVTAPNGGESWPTGSLHDITWTSANSNTDSIYYSTDNGASWSCVGQQAPPTSRTLLWTVPNTPSTNCLVRVTAIGSSTVSDQSNSVFAIAPADTGFISQPPIPDGPQHKTIKAGGCVAADPGTGGLYMLKGNNTFEFYRYDAPGGSWYTNDPIPSTDPDGKRRTVRNGASMAVAGGSVYVVKGGNSTAYWRYSAGAVNGTWSTPTTIPILKSTYQAWDGATYIYKLGYDTHARTALFSRFKTPDGPTENLVSPSLTPGSIGTPFRTGSCIVYYPDEKLSGDSRIFALSFATNDFYSYDILQGKWTYLNTLPMLWPGLNGKKKVGSGAGLVYADVNQTIYALTGNNTPCLWSYLAAPATWAPFALVPPGPHNKKVKLGGGITYLSNSLYVVKGGGTSECYSMSLLSWKDRAPTPGTDRQSAGSNPEPAFGLAVTPNPAVRNASVSFSLPRAGNISLKLYDATGQLVSTLAGGYHRAGSYSSQLTTDSPPQKLAAGIYVLRLDSDSGDTTQKLIIE